MVWIRHVNMMTAWNYPAVNGKAGDCRELLWKRLLLIFDEPSAIIAEFKFEDLLQKNGTEKAFCHLPSAECGKTRRQVLYLEDGCIVEQGHMMN